MIEAFGGVGYHVEDTSSLAKALEAALAARQPALINCVIDPTAGTESGHIESLNPKSALASQVAVQQDQAPKRAEISNGKADLVTTSSRGR